MTVQQVASPAFTRSMGLIACDVAEYVADAIERRRGENDAAADVVQRGEAGLSWSEQDAVVLGMGVGVADEPVEEEGVEECCRVADGLSRVRGEQPREVARMVRLALVLVAA